MLPNFLSQCDRSNLRGLVYCPCSDANLKGLVELAAHSQTPKPSLMNFSEENSTFFA